MHLSEQSLHKLFYVIKNSNVCIQQYTTLDIQSKLNVLGLDITNLPDFHISKIFIIFVFVFPISDLPWEITKLMYQTKGKSHYFSQKYMEMLNILCDQ